VVTSKRDATALDGPLYPLPRHGTLFPGVALLPFYQVFGTLGSVGNPLRVLLSTLDSIEQTYVLHDLIQSQTALARQIKKEKSKEMKGKRGV
jgi:hypothetical protein